MDKRINLLTPQEVAEMLQVTETTLKQWRAAGTGPSYVRLNRKTIRYAEEHVRHWIEEKRQ
jgi:predicted site-specific integrase-resolvase